MSSKYGLSELKSADEIIRRQTTESRWHMCGAHLRVCGALLTPARKKKWKYTSEIILLYMEYFELKMLPNEWDKLP